MRPPWAGPGSCLRPLATLASYCERLSDTSQQPSQSCGVVSSQCTWGPGPHPPQAPERWRAHHGTATPYGPFAVAGDWIHSRQVGSPVAAARIQRARADCCCQPAPCQAARSTHHPLSRSCIGAVGRHLQNTASNTAHTFRVSRASDRHNAVIVDPTRSPCEADRLPAPSLPSSLPQLHHLYHQPPCCPVHSAQQPPFKMSQIHSLSDDQVRR